MRLFRPKARLFQDQIVLITGGSRGLGLILARHFVTEGAQVILCARNPDELNRARERLRVLGGRVSTLVCDVAKRNQVEEMMRTILAKHGRLDVLVNNASIIQVGPAETMTHEDFETAMNVNFWGTVNTSLSILPEMIQRGCGKIVNITSVGGTVAVPHLLPYTCAKFAAVGFSQGLGQELSKYGIAVTTVIPGLMRTGSYQYALYKGREAEESTWFAASSRMPGISMNAVRAGRQILEACYDGRAVITLGLPAKGLRFLATAMPELASHFFRFVNLLLPGKKRKASAKRAA